jgi:hypothetical protein
VLAEAFFLRFVPDQANQKLAADHEAVMAPAQVASRIKVAHAGRGGRRSAHPRVFVPTWISTETIVDTLPTMGEGAPAPSALGD